MGLARYGAVYGIAGLTVTGIVVGGWAAFVPPLVIFGLIPLAEHFLPQSEANATPEQEAALRADRRYDVLLGSLVPVALLAVGLYVARVGLGHYDVTGLLGAGLCAGIAAGGLGINVAHELGHRKERWAQTLASLALFGTHYMHFTIEHNRGHHTRVATPDDPASARRGEVLYGFWLRSVFGSWRHALQLEVDRLRRLGRAAYGPQNAVMRYAALQGVALLLVGLWSPLAAVAWVLASLGGILLLETINYVEHYGLQRRQVDGRFERVRPVHSWNSNHALGRVLLFELTRHSDHHENPTRPYPVLRHFAEAPQLPTGYPGMVVLALVPPLFFRVMHRQLDAWQG